MCFPTYILVFRIQNCSFCSCYMPFHGLCGAFSQPDRFEDSAFFEEPAPTFSYAVIGGGSAGIAAVGILLDLGKSVLWVDPSFSTGRLDRYYGVTRQGHE